ncbi:MAG: hypothetical protein FNT15_05420 [Sulfurovum sp.]|nr:MAG: hypothetical protein FNT15_05420 [Sulfurovum sp.]
MVLGLLVLGQLGMADRYITSWGIENRYPSHPTVWQYANITLNDGSNMNAFARAPAYSSDHPSVNIIHRTMTGIATKSSANSGWYVSGCNRTTPTFNASYYSEIVEEIVRLCN